jgi:hypothetical protein
MFILERIVRGIIHNIKWLLIMFTLIFVFVYVLIIMPLSNTYYTGLRKITRTVQHNTYNMNM